MKAGSEQLRAMLKLPIRFLLAVTVLAGTLFAQRYQGRDHTIFHAPAAPPAKHAPSAAAANASAVAHPADATRRHDVNFGTSPASHSAASPQTAEPLHHPK
jgi:hypothetical protein